MGSLRRKGRGSFFFSLRVRICSLTLFERNVTFDVDILGPSSAAVPFFVTRETHKRLLPLAGHVAKLIATSKDGASIARMRFLSLPKLED